MKPTLLVLLSLCVFVAAMVPRHRRELNTDDDNKGANKTICAASTPCGWTGYKAHTKIIEFSMNNDYCTCSADMVCEIEEEDQNNFAKIHYCRKATETHS